jgi:glutamate 5-kinase
MASKIAAARIVTEAGGSCIVASGRDDDVIEAICRGEPIGTLFTGRFEAMPAWKRWLGWSADARGRLVVDEGARTAVVSQGRSLLAAGIKDVAGDFAAGDVVALMGADGGEFARGLANYPSQDVRKIAGLRTDRIVDVLGYCPYDEVIHRDNLAVVRRDAPAGPALR